MEKSHYAILFKPEYFALAAPDKPESENSVELPSGSTASFGSIVVSITQGGFGQDVVDDERQVKERFLEYMFAYSGLDVPRSEETFDKYFELRMVDELVDLDQEL